MRYSWMGLLEASVAGGIGIALFSFISMLCGERYRAKYKKIVWLLIALRLCVPVSSSFFPHAFTVQLPVYVSEQRESEQFAWGEDTATAVDGEEMVTDGGSPALEEERDITSRPTLGERRMTNSWNLLVKVWVCGCLFVLLYYIIGHFTFYRSMMLRSEVCREEKIRKAVSDIAVQLGLKRIPQVRIANKMETGPFTIGFFRNKIVLPNADYEEKKLHYVIRHELVHCASGDAQLKVLFVLVNIIHWFNPLVWLMKTLVDQDMELACDERVLAASTKAERKEYSDVIMSYVTKAAPGKSVLFTGYAHDIKFLKKRFSSIFNMHKKSGKVLGCLLVVLLMLTSGLIGFEAGQTVYAKDNVEADSSPESAPDLIGYGDFSDAGIFAVFLDQFFNGERYSSTDSSEYLQYEGFRGYSSLRTFPETLEDTEVIDYVYRYMDSLFDPTAEIYLECRYGEEDYQAEIARLQGIQTEYKGEVQTIVYDTENFAYPAYAAINGNDHCYEYALLLGDGKIAYIFLQFIEEEEISFPADYLPKGYEEEKEERGYSIYLFYQKDGSAIRVD